MNKKISKWLALAALLMFVGATFQITSDHYILGAICFVAAVVLLILQICIGKKKTKKSRKRRMTNEDP